MSSYVCVCACGNKKENIRFPVALLSIFFSVKLLTICVHVLTFLIELKYIYPFAKDISTYLYYRPAICPKIEKSRKKPTFPNALPNCRNNVSLKAIHQKPNERIVLTHSLLLIQKKKSFLSRAKNDHHTSSVFFASLWQRQYNNAESRIDVQGTKKEPGIWFPLLFLQVKKSDFLYVFFLFSFGILSLPFVTVCMYAVWMKRYTPPPQYKHMAFEKMNVCAPAACELFFVYVHIYTRIH